MWSRMCKDLIVSLTSMHEHIFHKQCLLWGVLTWLLGNCPVVPDCSGPLVYPRWVPKAQVPIALSSSIGYCRPTQSPIFNMLVVVIGARIWLQASRSILQLWGWQVWITRYSNRMICSRSTEAHAVYIFADAPAQHDTKKWLLRLFGVSFLVIVQSSQNWPCFSGSDFEIHFTTPSIVRGMCWFLKSIFL